MTKPPHIPPRPVRGSELKQLVELEREGATFLMYRDDGETFRCFKISDREQVTVGRSPDVDLSLSWDASVSRVHARLELVSPDDWRLVDDELSKNGSLVNGVPVTGRTRLCDRDLMVFGDTPVEFRGVSQSDVTLTVSRTPSEMGIPDLTPAERKVLVELARPMLHTALGSPATNDQIAESLTLGVNTIKTHMRALVQKLQVDGEPNSGKRAAVVRRALELGVIK